MSRVYLNTKHCILQLKKNKTHPGIIVQTRQIQTRPPPNLKRLLKTHYVQKKTNFLNHTGAIYKQSEAFTSHFTPNNPT